MQVPDPEIMIYGCTLMTQSINMEAVLESFVGPNSRMCVYDW